jgi:hypothetical protein
VGCPDGVWPRRAVAGACRHPARSRRVRGGRGAVGAERLGPALERRRPGHRSEGRAHRRGAGPRRRQGQPRAARHQGPLRLAAIGAPDRLRTPLVRDGDRLVETDWDTAMGRIVDRSRRLLARPGGWGRHGFYTSGQLFLEGVLHARGHREGRHRHAPHGRQHPAVHGDRRRGPEGELRDGRPTGLLHRRRPLRRPRAVGAQCRRDATGAVDAHARPADRRRPAGARRGGPPPPRCPPARRTSTSPCAAAPTSP